MLCRQMHSDEGTARDWLASMMELVAGMGSVAASAVLTPHPGRFSPWMKYVEARKQQLGAGRGAAEALPALLAEAVGIGSSGGWDGGV